jgi:hypothetical protein
VHSLRNKPRVDFFDDLFVVAYKLFFFIVRFVFRCQSLVTQ